MTSQFLCCFWLNETPSAAGVLSRILFWPSYLPGADHILAQPLKRCSASRIKPNERFELAKKRQNILCLRCLGVQEKRFLYVVAKLRVKSQKPWNISLSYSFGVKMGHFAMVRWKYDSVCIFSMLRDTLELICGRKQTKNAKIRRGAFFREGCFDRKECISNTANKRCSRQVLQLRCSSWYSIKFYT